MEGAWLDGGVWKEGGQELGACGWKVFERGRGRMEGWMEWFCGSVRAVRIACRCSGLRFFAVHWAERFLAVRFRFAVRFAAFLLITVDDTNPALP